MKSAQDRERKMTEKPENRACVYTVKSYAEKVVREDGDVTDTQAVE